MTIPHLRHAVVLVHGLLGYDRVCVGGWTVRSYFADIPDALRSAGNRVLVPRLSRTGGVAHRAAQLGAFLDREAPGEQVHLIAHSMGGLDSRYLISHLGPAGRVLSLTTLGTPHRGTAFADWGIRRIDRLARPAFELLDLSRQAFHDLTTESCAAFNEQTPDDPAVRYFSVAARFALDWTMPEWQLPYRLIEAREGPNDGLVSVASARWGECCDVWEGDHASLVNRATPVAAVSRRWPDRLPAYAALLQRLIDTGLG
jgi:triacylglycerol lipase